MRVKHLAGEVGSALVAKAGETVADQCKRNAIYQTNNLRVTTGGKICNYILHIALPEDTDQLEDVLLETISKADNLGVRTLALPAVGTGILVIVAPN